MSHPGTEHCKALGRLIGYLKVKDKKGIIIRNPKVLKDGIIYNSNFATDKETRKGVSGLVATLRGTLISCSSKTQGMIMFFGTEAKYVALSEFAQEVDFVNVLLKEMTEVHKPSVVYKGNQGSIFLANSRQVGMHTKHIFICHHFLRDVVEDKNNDIKYIRSE